MNSGYLNFISRVYPNLPTVKGYTLWELIFCKYNFFFFIYFPIFPFSHFGSNLFIELFKKKKVNLYNLNKIRDTSHTFMILKKIFYYICTYLYLKVEGDIKKGVA